MQILALDVGNTDIKFGLFEGDVLLRFWRTEGTQDIHLFRDKLTASVAQNFGESCQPLKRILYSNVRPTIETPLRKALEAISGLVEQDIIAVRPGQFRLPVDFSLYQSGQLGEDRLVNACGGHGLYLAENVIVVDFGTATTFDLVSADGIYRGGAIAPGLKTFADSLPGKAPRLPRLDLQAINDKPVQIGLNTQTCLEAGLGFGYRGLVQELLAASRKVFIDLNPVASSKIIATGGLAETAIQLCSLQSSFDAIDPTLTLKGLYQMYSGKHYD